MGIGEATIISSVRLGWCSVSMALTTTATGRPAPNRTVCLSAPIGPSSDQYARSPGFGSAVSFRIGCRR
jgi:hypothetical protein